MELYLAVPRPVWRLGLSLGSEMKPADVHSKDLCAAQANGRCLFLIIWPTVYSVRHPITPLLAWYHPQVSDMEPK